MSMNIHIFAIREVTVNKTGAISTQTIQFDCWQTPTKVSCDIIEEENPVEAYKQWVRDKNYVHINKIYESDDIFQEREPIGEETIDVSEFHINELNEWIEDCEKDGYTIEVEVW